MKIAYVHYHLKTGGVTTVLKRQVLSLKRRCDLLVITGDAAHARMPCPVEVIPELGYDTPGVRPDPDHTANKVMNTLNRAWPGGCDLVHIHNPILAKNREFLRVIKRLQKSGVNLFLQIHDFAEDGRPGAYFREPYPADCHYGVINARDKAILKTSGLDESGLHLLPNCVQGLLAEKSPGKSRDILYPVRAIRRKNLGEALLLSLFLRDGQRLLITQPPNSPADRGSYGLWVKWARENRLPVKFEAGRSMDFPSLVGGSKFVVTTSINEGFGYCFLEPWTGGKPLWGRRLDPVCRDFEQNGVCLDFLYNRLDAPLAWIGEAWLAWDWKKAVQNAAKMFGRRVSEQEVDSAFDRMTKGEKVDFGLLGEKHQRRVLDRLISHGRAKKELVRLNPFLADAGEFSVSPDVIEANGRAVEQHYGMEACGNRLLAAYEKAISLPVRHRIDKQAVLDAFFDPDRFSLLKWADYDQLSDE